jgi:hypothetical protein
MEKEFRSSQAMRPAWSQSFGLLLGHATRLVAILRIAARPCNPPGRNPSGLLGYATFSLDQYPAGTCPPVLKIDQLTKRNL